MRHSDFGSRVRLGSNWHNGERVKNTYFAISRKIACQTRTEEAAAYRCSGKVEWGVYMCVVTAISDTWSPWQMRSNLVKWSKKRILHQVGNVFAADQAMLPDAIPSVSGGFRGQRIDWW
jgi:hypothetical protein